MKDGNKNEQWYKVIKDEKYYSDILDISYFMEDNLKWDYLIDLRKQHKKDY